MTVTSAPTTWPQRLRWISWCGVLLCLFAAGLAAVEFRSLRHIVLVDVPFSAAETTAQDGIVCGMFHAGLPSYRLRWDGEPPRAWLADRQSGQPVAPPLMLEASLSLNANGVLWTRQGACQFAVDETTVQRLGDRLVLRAEQYRSRSGFYFWSLLATGLALAAFVCRQQARIQAAPAWRQPTIRWDESRAMGFVILSLLSVLVFFPGHPVAHMSGDPANIHSFAAGLSQPDAFKGDAVLSDPANFAWYTPLYVKFVQIFGDVGFHFATSRAFLSLISALAGLFGYYLLFRCVSRSPLYAFAATIGLWFLKAHYPPNENWGPMLVLPRTVYGAFLPWVALLALRLVSRRQWWWLPSAASGVLFYVHPVSSPALTGAILMGFLLGGPGKFWSRLAWGTWGGIVALAVMFPYVMVYAGKYSGTVVTDPVLTQQAFEAARERFAPGYLEPLVFYRDVLIYLATTPRYWLAFVALYLLVRYRRNSLAARVSVGMTAGFIIVTCLIPTIDVTVSSAIGRLPFQIDLIRNLRYLDVWLLGIVGALVREINRPDWGRAWRFQLQVGVSRFLDSRQLSWKLVPAAAVAWVIVCFAPSATRSLVRLVEFSYDNATILVGKPKGFMAEEIEAFRAVRTLRQADEVIGGSFHLRQMGIPVATNNKDLGVLAYSSPVRLVGAKQVLRDIDARSVWPLDRDVALDQAAILNADLLLLPREAITPSLARSPEVLFQNASHLLLRLDPQQITARRQQLAQPVVQVSRSDRQTN